MPNFFQQIKCPTRNDKTLDHCCTSFKKGYKSIPIPAFGKSDHNAIFLMLEHKQKMMPEPVVTREVRLWTAESEETLCDALSDVDWEMFWESTDNDVSVFTDVVTSFVATLTDNVIPSAMVKSFPNQKPWVNRSIRAALKECTTTYNTGLLLGDMTEYKAACYKLRRDIAYAKRRYRGMMEAQFQKKDTRSIWR